MRRPLPIVGESEFDPGPGDHPVNIQHHSDDGLLPSRFSLTCGVPPLVEFIYPGVPSPGLNPVFQQGGQWGHQGADGITQILSKEHHAPVIVKPLWHELPHCGIHHGDQAVWCVETVGPPAQPVQECFGLLVGDKILISRDLRPGFQEGRQIPECGSKAGKGHPGRTIAACSSVLRVVQSWSTMNVASSIFPSAEWGRVQTFTLLEQSYRQVLKEKVM
ncbi:hypothetical protein HNQ08_005582 [Deinococcus humi]|uniref:Uncharacterized protein n=1 Tax=Deinococcus humi TaxID=662880 RepID=A0A7W8K2M4_9DEIO|nr:hypothetical protein [Deinococcus humi]MBB5366453.1 hypothetical protein [Deinococcus humi]